MSIEDKLIRTIDGMRNEIIDFLSSLVEFETPNPPGGNTSEAQKWFEDKLMSLGFETESFEVFSGDPDVVGILHGEDNGRSLILNGHMDVAEVRPDEEWRYPPFKATIRGNKVYGRGTDDMKGGLTAIAMAMEAIERANINLRGDVIIESVVGEEAGEPGTVRCIEKGYKADFAIVPEPTSFKISGQGGVITGWITVKSPITLHDGVRRRCIHAGGGLEGASAIEKMMKVISALQELERYWGVVKNHPLMPPGSTTINPAVIKGGRHPAFMADECNLWVTIHLLPNEDYEEVIKEIEDYLKSVERADLWMRKNPLRFRWGGKSLTKDKGEIFPPADIDPSHPGVKTLSEAHRRIFGADADVAMWPSVCDAGWLAKAGIPAVIYGPGSLERAHAVDEFIEIDEVMKAVKVLALMILNWCGYSEGDKY